MRRTTKFIATIIAMCLVVTLGVIGIFAVKTLNMNVGGNITFSADGLSLEVFDGEFKTTSGADYSNITTQEGKLQGFEIDTNTKQSDIQSKIDSWTNLELTLDSKGSAVLHFAVKNNMTTPLYVYIATELGTNTNNNMDILVSPNGTEIGAGLTTNFEITFDILDTSINAGLKGFNVAVTFAKESLVKSQNKIDQTTGIPTTEVDYYYIEMGTYNGEPVRWRYIADANGVHYDGTSPVTSLSGYYVLDKKILENKMILSSEKYDASTNKYIAAGYTNINANDYGLSDIRAYLTNTGSGGFIEELGITTDNIVYKMITSRSLTDLYSGITGAGTAIDSTDTSYCLSLTGDKDISNQSDKFWLLSLKELLTLFADQESRAWGAYFWLRSPVSSTANYVYDVGSSGNTGGFHVHAVNGIRPAFKI